LIRPTTRYDGVQGGEVAVSRLVMRAVAFAFLAALVSCARPQEIRIGLLAMLSGENAANGENMKAAALLAIERAAGLRLRGRPVRVSLLVSDDGGTPDSALEAARRLIYKERVVALVGPQFSSNAIPVARLAEQDRVVMVAPMSTHPDTTAGKRFVFRIPYMDTFQGRVVARFARERLKSRRAAVLYDVAGAYNRTLAELFRSSFEAAGGAIVAFETYTSDRNLDYSAQLRRVAAADPDVLFLPNYAADVLLQARQARASGVRAVLLGGDGWDARRFAGVPEFDGSFFATPWPPEAAGEAGSAFISAFRSANGRDPDEVAATTYDGFGLLLTAVGRAARADAPSIRDAIASSEGYRGVTGLIRYRDGGAPEKSAVIVRLSAAAAVVEAVVEP